MLIYWGNLFKNDKLNDQDMGKKEREVGASSVVTIWYDAMEYEKETDSDLIREEMDFELRFKGLKEM